jgi:RNA polymerase sigma factor (sigma-70 family)
MQQSRHALLDYPMTEPHSSDDSRVGLDADMWFKTHVQPHEPMLRAWLTQGFGARLTVDDVVQEAFLRVLRARATGELQSPKAFLFATARNLALDQMRRHHVSRTDSLVEADYSNVLDHGESIPDHVARNQERALLTEAIQSLPDRCRQVMTLRIVYGLSQRIIGEKLGISDRTVAAQLAIGTMKCTDYLLRRTDQRRNAK